MNRMLQILTLIALMFSSYAFGEHIFFTGKVRFNTGVEIDALKIDWYVSLKNGKIPMVTQNNLKIGVKPKDISSVYFVKTIYKEDSVWMQKGSEILVKLTNGKEASMRYAEVHGKVYIDYLDDFTSELNKKSLYYLIGATQKQSDSRIVSMDFTGTGDTKTNTNTNQYFPQSFNFDPYTGESLSFVKKKE